MDFRPASEADLEAEYEVFNMAEGEVCRRHSFPWEDPPFEAFAAPHRHLLARDAERAFVAEEDDRVVAFSAAFVRGANWFLSALFVQPDFQGRGVGSRLLDLSWDGEYDRRITITDSIQPVSNGLYAQRGLIPTTPILHLEGTPRADHPPGLEPGSLEPRALAALDRAAYGFERAADHIYWAESAARRTLWERRGEPVAYSYARPGRIGPIAGRDPRGAADALRAEFARSGDEEVLVQVPGSAFELVEAALAAGLRFTDAPGLLLLSRAVEAPRALAISNYWLL